jgi:membrane associated rhomboid family serine protease
MIPIRDDTPRFSTPYVTYFLIALNTAIFLFEWSVGLQSKADLNALIFQFGVVPRHVTALVSGTAHVNPVSALLPLFTCMFLHGSWLHVIGNMWFLWIFGDNIEDYLGHFSYLVFYLVSGIAASLLQIVLSPTSRVPTIGASGAIAGVMGAFLVLYPKARVLTIVPLIIFFTFWWLPAWVFLGYWFVLEFLSGTATSIAATTSNAGGIAFWAHVGGFLAGIILIKLMPERPHRSRYGAY